MEKTRFLNIRINLMVDEGLDRRLRIRAAEERTSVSALIRKAAEEYLDR